VILDLDMPGMQGLAGVAALRSLYPTAPLVIVSATRNPAAMRQAVEMGAAGFIPKSRRWTRSSPRCAPRWRARWC
jgi:DNA-binding NarL/FixJ family response regulator